MGVVRFLISRGFRGRALSLVVVLSACGGSRAPAATSSAPRAVRAVEAGALLAAAATNGERLEVPHDWQPGYPGIYPPLASQLSESWDFDDHTLCRRADYGGDFSQLQAAHPAWTTLVSKMTGDERFSEALIREGKTALLLQRSWGEVRKVRLTTCMPAPREEPAAIALGVMHHIPALDGHEGMLSIEGAIPRSIFYARSESRGDVVEVVFIVAPFAASAWRDWPIAHGYAKPLGSGLMSVQPRLSYALARQVTVWRAQLVGRTRPLPPQ